MPQPPQLPVSFVVLMQKPLQLVSPCASQLSVGPSQTPPTQSSPAPASQTTPQAPQLFGSFGRSTPPPPQSVRPSSHPSPPPPVQAPPSQVCPSAQALPQAPQ